MVFEAVNESARRRCIEPLGGCVGVITNLLFQVFCSSRIKVVWGSWLKHTQLLYGLIALLIKDTGHKPIIAEAL